MAKPKFLYESRFNDGTLAASSTAAGNFDVNNLKDFRPYTWWQPASLPATVTVDCGSSKSANYSVVYGHNLFSKGCTYEVRGSTDNFSASDVLVASLAPSSDDPFYLGFTPTSFRYWRLGLFNGTAPSLAIVAIGTSFDLTVGLMSGFDPLGRKIDGQSNQNLNGQPLGKVIDFEGWEQTLNLERVTWDWARNTFLPAWRASLRSSPFIFAWDTDAFPAELRLVTVKDMFATPHFPGSTCDLQLALRGVVS